MSKNVIPLYPLKVFNFIHLKKAHLTEIPKTFHYFLTKKGTYNFLSYFSMRVLQKRLVMLENMRKKIIESPLNCEKTDKFISN